MASEKEEDGPHSAAKDLLFEDFRYLSDAFWKYEQAGETGFNWYIGITTAVIGGLVTLATEQLGLEGEPLLFVVIGGLFALLVYGLITLVRLTMRNKKFGCLQTRSRRHSSEHQGSVGPDGCSGRLLPDQQAGHVGRCEAGEASRRAQKVWRTGPQRGGDQQHDRRSDCGGVRVQRSQSMPRARTVHRQSIRRHRIVAPCRGRRTSSSVVVRGGARSE